MVPDTEPHRIAAEHLTGAGTVAGIALAASRWREGDALNAAGRKPVS